MNEKHENEKKQHQISCTPKEGWHGLEAYNRAADKAVHEAIVHDDVAGNDTAPNAVVRHGNDSAGIYYMTDDGLKYYGVDMAKEGCDETVMTATQKRELDIKKEEFERKYMGPTDYMTKDEAKKIFPQGKSPAAEHLDNVKTLNDRAKEILQKDGEFHNLKLMLIFSNLQAIKEYQTKAFGFMVPVHVLSDPNGNELTFMDASASHKHYKGKRPDKVIMFTKRIKESIRKELVIMNGHGVEILMAPDG